MKKNYSSNLKKYSALAGSAVLAGSRLANAQIIYTDVAPDSVLNEESFQIDLDNNGQGDLNFRQQSSGGGAYGTYAYSQLTNISGSNTQITVTGGNYAQALNLDDTIKSVSTFNSNGFALLGTYWGGGQFLGAGDKYVGFRFDISGQWHYGWALINVASDASNLTVRSYAYNATPNAEILAGQTSIVSGTDAELAAKINVYPNPTSDLVSVDGIDVSSISVVNQSGVEVASSNASSINLSDLPTGSYVLKIVSESGVVSKNIIKE